ncbi:MAG TPA: MBL fold metallo-hydrolase [Micropepsaceae bacterium]|nr:MBL fold metallo-hydrolase [Micropepsaceae bacterium]
MGAELKVTILGSGSSGGVPRIGPNGPDWGACDPANPKNRRRRCAILVQRGETSVLVDTSPDMREQLIDAGCGRLDAVLITHDHADQTHGLDDLRMVAQNMRRRVRVISDQAAITSLSSRFSYCFHGAPGGYPQILEAEILPEPFVPSAIEGKGGPVPFHAFAQDHGSMRSLGFRFGPVAYSSDLVRIPEESHAALTGLDCWIVDSLRESPHPTHTHLAQTLEWIRHFRPKRAILTNLHIDLDYERLRSMLPANVEPAFDGMIVQAQLPVN